MSEAILFDRVNFQYPTAGPGARWVLKGFSLRIGQGEFHVVLGPSGCGKTTLLKLAAGFEHPASGEVRVGERPVTDPGSDRVMIFQGDDSLYPWLTASENVEFGLRIAGLARAERRARALAGLELVGLKGHETKFPGQLSGGMKQRVQLARALVTNPTILLMDEPFGALDAQTRGVLQKQLATIWQRTRCTIVFITHDVAEAALLADRVSVMTSGPDATIHAVVDIALPRPRSIVDRQFGAVYARLGHLLAGDPPGLGPDPS